MKRKTPKAAVITRHETRYPFAEITGKLPQDYLVKVNGVTVCAINKYPNTATDTFPWQAFNVITGQGPVRRGSTSIASYTSEAAVISKFLTEVRNGR